MTLKVKFSEVYHEKEEGNEEKWTTDLISSRPSSQLKYYLKNAIKKMTLKVIFSEVLILYDEKEEGDEKRP